MLTCLKMVNTASYLLNNLRNFKEIFRNDVTYDNNKSHKKQDFSLSLETTFLKKKHRGEHNCPFPTAFLGLTTTWTEKTVLNVTMESSARHVKHVKNNWRCSYTMKYFSREDLHSIASFSVTKFNRHNYHFMKEKAGVLIWKF